MKPEKAQVNLKNNRKSVAREPSEDDSVKNRRLLAAGQTRPEETHLLKDFGWTICGERVEGYHYGIDSDVSCAACRLDVYIRTGD